MITASGAVLLAVELIPDTVIDPRDKVVRAPFPRVVLPSVDPLAKGAMFGRTEGAAKPAAL